MTLLIISNVVAFVVGFLICWVFWRYLLMLKPRIAICNRVVRTASYRYPDKEVLKFKVYNSSNRQAIDIEAGATILSKRDVPGGERSYVVKRLDVVAPSMEVLGPKRNLGDLMGLSPVRVFAARIPDEFDKHLSGESTRLAFTLRATDALSGTTVVFRRLYGKSDIRYGEFRYGLAFDVEPTKREGSCNNEGEEGAGP